jgi:cysteine synthase
MQRKPQIMKQSTAVDYSLFEQAGVAFDYEMMMREAGYSLKEIQDIQADVGVGNTPLLELKNITALARFFSKPGKGARIFVKDEACNPSGSFKARRAAVSAFHAKRLGYSGIASATSGNYGAAVASQAAMRGLKAIICQEVFDSQGVNQPEIEEKGRVCEAYGAEVMQLSVGPELFYKYLLVLEETGFFNASLYTPFGIAGVETLGYELAEQVIARTGRMPDAVVVTHAGGGNVTGTARGLIKAGCADTKIIAASVDLKGLHMASDIDFNKKSFTTGHTGFGVPFATMPDRADVPRNAARSLRYMDRYVLITQGEVFYTTEMLAQLEGLERGPAGNTSLAAAFVLAQEMDSDQILVVQETEYTGAGKSPGPQLTFAKQNGIDVSVGNPRDSIPGKNIIIPDHPNMIRVIDFSMTKLRTSYIKNILVQSSELTLAELEYVAAETKQSVADVEKTIFELSHK